MTPPSTDRAAFNGTIGRRYHDRLVPLIFRDYAADLAARLGPIADAAVLETAAGTGAVTERLCAVLPPTTALTVTDLSPDMLAVARDELSPDHAARITFAVADATALGFADSSFDAVVCQFGVMFFPDEAGGYREAARVLKPGGRFLFNVWDDLAHNPIVGCANDVLHELAPDDPPRFMETPFRRLEMTTIVRNLQAACFDEVRAVVLPKPCRASSAAAVVETFLQSSPWGAQVAERGLTEKAVPAVTQAVAARFAGGRADAPFEAPMQAVVFEAIKA